ncbi:hypothetical protein HAX54_042578, partial [Datura stramonium]|nr:hypothetical protein [Datura stramonium]
LVSIRLFLNLTWLIHVLTPLLAKGATLSYNVASGTNSTPADEPPDGVGQLKLFIKPFYLRG